MTGYHRMRRQARQVRRSGMQPMMVFNSRDQLPETAGVVLLRWAWRYRSELAPLAVTARMLAASWWLHATQPHWWPLLAERDCSGRVGGGPTFGARWRFPTLIERMYTATATVRGRRMDHGRDAVGPFLPHRYHKPWQSARLVLSVPWWAHRRRRARVRVERKLEAWPDIAKAVGLAGSQIMSAVVDVWGWRARLRLARGQTIADVTAKIPAIESGLGTFRGALRVYPTPDDLANRCEIRVLDMDPHADAIPWPGPSVDIDHRANRPGAVRGRHAVPGTVPAPARPCPAAPPARARAAGSTCSWAIWWPAPTW